MCAASMTGFGRAELKLAGKSYAIEIASVNQKNLQISVYGPEEWPTLESVVSNAIRQFAQVFDFAIFVRLVFRSAGGLFGLLELAFLLDTNHSAELLIRIRREHDQPSIQAAMNRRTTWCTTLEV